jgi:soluble lytic murein transglycosylase-like protein
MISLLTSIARKVRRGTFAALFAVALLALIPAPTISVSDYLANTSAALTGTVHVAPTELTAEDIALYNSSFMADARGDTRAADDNLARVANPRLAGYVLAARYLGNGYKATAAELTQWLMNYADHPQADDIRRLAVARGANLPAAADTQDPLKGQGYSDHLGRTGMPDGWYHALTLWREGDYAGALPLFISAGDDASLSDWQRAAGHYWAYRAATKLGDKTTAHAELAEAARYPTTFYGMLAAPGGIAKIKPAAPEVSDIVRNNPAAIRAALLVKLDCNDEAEDELRALYGRLPKEERPGLVTLASELHLPNLQLRLANMPQLSKAEKLFASYPMPDFILNAQSDVNPALLLAIARNESAFRDTAASGAGAVGMMQILPSTAHAIERRVGREQLQVASTSVEPIITRLNDPATSARYSAEYLKMLKRESAVGNNLVRVVAAYNAGPGSVANWQSLASNVNDPLLYIESIPYAETRNYVMQVIAQYWVYQTLRGEKPETLSAVTRGIWPALATAKA